MSARFVSVSEAVAAIPDGATVATDGFSLMGVAESVFAGIASSFRAHGRPRDLTLVHASGQSNRVAGFEHFAIEGLARRIVGSHWGLMPRISAFLGQNAAEAVCLPQGQVAALYRAIAAGRPGIVTKVGLGTFIDPAFGGGKINDVARDRAPDYVERVQFDGEDFLFYKAFPIDVGIIRATAVDDLGNCDQEEEAVFLDALAIAQAAHNSGGIVICQAKRRVPAGTLRPKDVRVPACLVDLVVLTPDPEREHRQTDGAAFDPRYVTAGAVPGPSSALPETNSPRHAIGQRAVRFLRSGDVLNIGTGIPGDTIGQALAEANLLDAMTITVESGTYGGVPAGGVDFGIAAGPAAIIPHASQFDFYDGGGLDATFMGVGQVDQFGNVNVSLLGGRVIGCGGFVDITQSAKRIYFCFEFGGRHKKFVESVDHLTFSASEAIRRGQTVYYITERAVFQLCADGLRLTEVAEGVDPRRDVIEQLPFPVSVPATVPVGRPHSAVATQGAGTAITER